MGNDLGPHPWRHMPPDREPAPGALRLVEAFVNTVNHERAVDAIATDAGLRGWLVEFGLDRACGTIGSGDVAAAGEVREAIRALLRTNAGAALDPAAVAVLDRAADRTAMTLRFGAGGSRIVARGLGIDAVLGLLLGIVHDAIHDGSFGRLRSCRNERCAWAFYDRSRNLSASWCSMAICGNRMKIRSYRSRKAAALP